MSEPSFIARIWDFFCAVITYWTAWVTGVVFVIEQAAEFFFPKRFAQFDKRFPKEKRRKFLLWFCAFGFVVASFQAFDDVSYRLRQTQQFNPAGEERHLTDDQKTRIREALRLSPDENYHVDFNSLPNCDECEDFAEELREFVATIPGWKIGGGPAMFWDNGPRLIGLELACRQDEKDFPAQTKLKKAFDSAGSRWFLVTITIPKVR